MVIGLIGAISTLGSFLISLQAVLANLQNEALLELQFFNFAIHCAITSFFFVLTGTGFVSIALSMWVKLMLDLQDNADRQSILLTMLYYHRLSEKVQEKAQQKT